MARPSPAEHVPAADVVERVEIQRIVAPATFSLQEPYRRTIPWR